jgi:putative toxin-antitoxin system antitoxin component (TIGR02293 family)
MGTAASLRRTDPGITRLTRLLGGKAVLGRNVRTTEDLEQLLDEGISMDAFEGLARAFQIAPDDLASVLGISARTLARRRRERVLRADEGDRLARAARVLAHGVDVLGSAATVGRWLQKPNRALGDRTPLSYLGTDAGTARVESVLGRIEWGIPS